MRLSEAIEALLLATQANGKSPETVKAYREKLGYLLEALGDVAFALAPLSAPEAEELVRGIRAFPLLAGARGRPPVHLAGLVAAVERISHLAAEFPEIAELDVNPILCYPDRVVAVDLRVTVSGAEGLPWGRGQP